MSRIALGFLAALTLAGCAAQLTDEAQKAVDQLLAVNLADVHQAQQLAYFNDDKAGIECWGALAELVAYVQSFPKPLVIGPATAAQIFSDLTNPSGKVNVACAAAKATLKARVQQVVGGGIMIFSPLGGGLPL